MARVSIDEMVGLAAKVRNWERVPGGVFSEGPDEQPAYESILHAYEGSFDDIFVRVSREHTRDYGHTQARTGGTVSRILEEDIYALRVRLGNKEISCFAYRQFGGKQPQGDIRIKEAYETAALSQERHGKP